MGTMNHPGKFDILSVHPDEPMFRLLGRDPMAGSLVRLWAKQREAENEDPEKVAEARECAKAMDSWALQHGKYLRRNEFERVCASSEAIVNFVEWLADQPCVGNGSGKLCRINSPDDPTWCCHACRAYLLRYGTDPSKWASTG
jgi:hypothetical protein